MNAKVEIAKVTTTLYVPRAILRRRRIKSSPTTAPNRSRHGSTPQQQLVTIFTVVLSLRYVGDDGEETRMERQKEPD